MKAIDKMKLGLWYDANYDEDLNTLRLKADDLCFELNQTRPSEVAKRHEILKSLIFDLGESVTILSPLYADYGTYVSIGDHTFINHNAYLMDGGGITIGAHCFIGPNCGMYTANHPLISAERNMGFEQAKPIVIEDNVWIGADVTITPGVTIGEGSVIGAKTLVNKDVPKNVVAIGNPVRILRSITDKDSIKKEIL